MVLSNGCRELIATPSSKAICLLGLTMRSCCCKALGSAIPDSDRRIPSRGNSSSGGRCAATSLLSRPVDAAGWTTRFAQLTASSHTVADMAQALAQERADGPEGELRFWADAVRDALRAISETWSCCFHGSA